MLNVRCGSLMAELETRALAHGHAVLTWRATRSVADPIKAARQAGVDLVVRIREQRRTLLPHRELHPGPIRYAVSTIDGDPVERSLKIGGAAAAKARCERSFAALLARPVTVTELAAEAIDPGSGKAIWRLSRVVDSREFTDGRLRVEHGVRVRTRMIPMGNIAWALVLVGGIYVGTFRFVDMPANSPLEAFPLGWGLAGVAAAATLPRWLKALPTPNDVLCKGRPAHWRRGSFDHEAAALAGARVFATELFGHLGAATRRANSRHTGATR